MSRRVRPRSRRSRVQQVEDLRRDRGVERRRGLVGEQESRPAHERQSEQGALPQPSGEPMGILVQGPLGIRESHVAQRRERQPPRLGARDVEVEAEGLPDLRPDGLHGIQRGGRLLEDQADLAAADGSPLRIGEPEQIAPAEPDAAGDAGGLRREPQDRARELRLAAAALADERDGLPRLQREGDAADERAAARLPPEAPRSGSRRRAGARRSSRARADGDAGARRVHQTLTSSCGRPRDPSRGARRRGSCG